MSSTFTTFSPIDGSVYVERNFTGKKDISTCLLAGKEGQQIWKTVPLFKRKILCSKAVDYLVSHKQEIAKEICWQMGRPIRFAEGEIAGLEERARTMIELADEALAPVKLPNKKGFERWIQREPAGLVFVIAPWNYPYLTAVNAIIPAILAGNSIILKHSAQTPLCAERFFAAFEAAGLPQGVFQYLHLNHIDTKRIIRDPRLNYIAFTGSVPGGEMVEQAAAGRFVGIGLELGGKDPAYIRQDADLDHAVDSTMDGAFFNSGQSCCGIERIYVHENVCDDFVKKSVSWVKKMRLGRPDNPETTLGPLVRPGAADFVRQQIFEAIEQGAIAHISADDYPMDSVGSAYMAPQVLTNVDHSMRIMTEESFGPVIGIQKVGTDAEALELMNDSEFGLTAAIFTSDIKKGVELGQQIETGTFFVNRCDYLDPELAWTGVKKSGRGCSLSRLGYDSLTRPKSFHIKTEI